MTHRETAPTRGLTPKFIESLGPAEKAYEVPDRAAPGLRLRVLPTGKKVFRWEVSSLKLVLTLGRWAFNATPGHLTLHEARQWLQRLKQARAGGREPLDAAVRELQEQTRPSPGTPVAAPPLPATTVRQVADDFYTIRIKPVRKSHKLVLRVLNKDIVPVLGPDTDIKAVTPRTCGSVVEAVLARGKIPWAGLVLDFLKQFTRWATATGRIDKDPAALITRDTYGISKSQRDRNLSDEELLVVWSTLAAERKARKHALALQQILLTGVRKMELCRAERRYVDCEAGTWTIPVRHQKKSRKQEKLAKDFVIPLAPAASDVMREMLALPGSSPFVLPGASPGKHLRGDELLRYLHEQFGTSKKQGRISLPGKSITVHDLRRTMRTKLSELGVSPDIAERCLNHTRKDAYDKFDYLPQRREALEKWANHIEQLVANAQQKQAA